MALRSRGDAFVAGNPIMLHVPARPGETFLATWRLRSRSPTCVRTD